MKRSVAILAVVSVMGCSGGEEQPKPKVEPTTNMIQGCYTVDLFDPWHVVPPGPDVPKEDTAFLGAWKNGAWGGHWCHDLYVTEVKADGSVEVLDAYGPWQQRGIEATVFRRHGRIRDGVLTIGTQGGIAKYHLEGDYLMGERQGTYGDMNVMMSREDSVAEAPKQKKRKKS